ncbi:probable cytochrome P450 313a4 [Zerene cesonia]|uniref:probable cytochrome P450 313a4 n=1 Tax=Zerene cesonia TaxID=33412 RepID=UPI0018E53840|nr:probable cytochrome P450 313a4 [Zerene cesonia]
MRADGITIPENISVLISIWGLHRNKKYWGPDADCFDPDRFLPERYTQVPSGCYIPFIAGPRNCPGYSYAMMSMKITLCVLLKNFRVLPDPEDGPIPHIRVKFDITMSVLDDKVALEKR